MAAGVEEVAPGSLLMPSLKFRRNCKHHTLIASYSLLSYLLLFFPSHSTPNIFLSFLSSSLFPLLFSSFHGLDYTADLSHHYYTFLLPLILPPSPIATVDNVDREALGDLFNQYDSDKSGTITLDELETMLSHLGVGTYLPSISIFIFITLLHSNCSLRSHYIVQHCTAMYNYVLIFFSCPL